MTESDLLGCIAEMAGVEPSQVHADTPLFSTGLLDSMSVMELSAFVEAHAGVRIKASEITLEHMDTVRRILKFVQSKKAIA